MALQQYKCPCCSGAIEFNPNAQRMKCPFCDTEFDMDTLIQYDADLNTDNTDHMEWNAEHGEWHPDEASGMRVYSCQSCGGEIIVDDTTAATSCPYCDNPVVMMGQFTGALKPQYVIPFKLGKDAAVAALKKHLEGKKFLPRVFKDQNHIDEIKGMYVPFWLFDTKSEGGARYDATKVSTRRSGNYRITETEHFSVVREGTMAFDNVPVDGSSKMPDELMESIGPFDFSEAVDFQTAYLAGYFADKYDVEAETSVARANERVRESVVENFRNTVKGYSSVTCQSDNIRLINASAKYALYPVWMLSTTWENNNYLFAMNGQTGKFVGNLPCDKKLYWKTFGIIGSISAAAIFAVGMLFMR